ncbi:MAG: type IV secretion system DNA-binding domain-containing protein [Acidobacteriota bacterium]|nr:type IV secretion system DNA-binding domain-containing protein [Acidobacteriota bacterium]
MNSAYLRPPIPVFRVLAFCTLPLLLWVAVHVEVGKLGPLQTLYWSDYLCSTVPSFELPQFGQASKAKTEYQVLLCTGAAGHEVPLTVNGRPLPEDMHLAPVPMTASQYNPWLRRNIYGGQVALGFLLVPFLVSAMFVALLAGGGFLVDQKRLLKFRSQERHIKGPELVTPAEFSRRVKGNGIGFRVERLGRKPGLVRIERSVEVQHQLMQGDNGAGKTVAMFALADQFEAAGETCIYYDPDCQFLKRYWKPGDFIFGPDERSASYSPADEIDYTSVANAEATAMSQAESLYPGRLGTKDFFFTNSARLIYKHCLTNYRPNAAQLAQFYIHADPLIDAIAKGTELEEMLRKNTPGLRASIISTLTQCLFALQQIPGEELGRPKLSAREYVGMKGRRPSIFFTASENTKTAFSPLHRLMIDSLIRQFLSQPEQPEPVVRMFLDELPALGELSTMKDASSRGRKYGIDLILGFQGRSQLKAIYGEEVESIFSAPFTKLLLHTGEPDGADWASRMLGEHDIECLTEHLSADGKRSYSTQQRANQRLVTQSELGSLKNRAGYLRYAGYVVKLKLALPPGRAARCEAFIARTGVAPVQLPMPNLEAIRAQEQKDKQRAAEQAAAKPYQPPTPTKPQDGGIGALSLETSGD